MNQESCYICKTSKNVKVLMDCGDSYCLKCLKRIIFINHINELQESEKIRVRCKCKKKGHHDIELQNLYKTLKASLLINDSEKEKCVIHQNEGKAIYCKECGHSVCKICSKDSEHHDHSKVENGEIIASLKDFMNTFPLSFKTADEFIKHFDKITNTIKNEIEKIYSASFKSIDNIIQTLTTLKIEYAKKMKEKLESNVLLLKLFKLFYGSYYYDYQRKESLEDIFDLKYLKDITKELTNAQVVINEEVVSKLKSLKEISEELRNKTNEKGIFGIKFTFKEMSRQLNQIGKLFGHKGMVYCVIQLRDGRLCTGSDDYTIRFWEEINGEFNNTITISESTGKVISLIQLRDERIISSAKDNLTARVWIDKNHDGKYICEQTLQVHNESVTALLQMSDDSLVTASRDKTIKIWEMSNQIFQNTQTLTEHKEGVYSLCELGNGRLVSGSEDALIKIWVEKDTKYYCSNSLIGHKKRVRSIIQMKCGHLMSGGDDCNVNIWKENGEVFDLCISFAAHHNAINCIIQLKDSRIITVSRDKSLRVWVETVKGWSKKEVHRDHSINVFCVIQLQDGRLASSSGDNQVIIWKSGIMAE